VISSPMWHTSVAPLQFGWYAKRTSVYLVAFLGFYTALTTLITIGCAVMFDWLLYDPRQEESQYESQYESDTKLPQRPQYQFKSNKSLTRTFTWKVINWIICIFLFLTLLVWLACACYLSWFVTVHGTSYYVFGIWACLSTFLFIVQTLWCWFW